MHEWEFDVEMKTTERLFYIRWLRENTSSTSQKSRHRFMTVAASSQLHLSHDPFAPSFFFSFNATRNFFLKPKCFDKRKFPFLSIETNPLKAISHKQTSQTNTSRQTNLNTHHLPFSSLSGLAAYLTIFELRTRQTCAECKRACCPVPLVLSCP